MPTFSSLQIPPPTNWQDFETLCCDLWRKIWQDPNTQKNGRQGQPQHGVDVCGRPNQGELNAGVQCKGKDNYVNTKLTDTEVRTAVEQAKDFEPKLSEFIIATTGPRDGKIQKLARHITEKQIKKKLFSVNIWFWDDIKNRLADFPELIEKHFPEFGSTINVGKEDIDEIKKATQEILENNADVKSSIVALSDKIGRSTVFDKPDTSTLISEYQAELDHSRDLLKNFKAKEALVLLEKLKNRIWSNAPAIVKYRILTNIGAANLQMNREYDAAKLFLEALQYNPEDEKAMCNCALGYLLLEQLSEARTCAEKVLTKNPANAQAYSIIVRTAGYEDTLENLIATVPEQYRNLPDVAYAFSCVARKINNLSEVKRWLEIAIKNDTENSPDLQGAFGEVLLELIVKDKSIVYDNQINDAKKEMLDKSIQLFTSAWQRIANTDLRNYRIGWIVNRSIAKRFLDDIGSAIKDVEIALEAEPANPMYIKHRAILANENNDIQTAITMLKTIKFAQETPEIPLLLAVILRNEHKYDEAIQILNEFLERKPPSQLQDEASRLLIQLHLDNKDIENAKKIFDSMNASGPSNILNLVNAARISKFSGNSSDAISFLKEAKKILNHTVTFRQLMEIANEFYFLEQFEDASEIYEKITDKTVDSPLIRRLLYSYYQSGKRREVLQICQTLRSKYGPLKHITEMASAIYEETGNLSEAKRVCKEYINSFPGNFVMKLRLAVVNFRSNNFDELDKFLNSVVKVNVDNLSLIHCLQLAHLYSARNLTGRAFEILYGTRRQYYNNGQAHLSYIQFFFLREKSFDKWLSCTKVGADSAVCIEDNSGRQEWYVIVDRKDADVERREINLTHSFAKELIGKSVNDEICLKSSPLSQEYGKIIEIKSKYVYALHESLSIFEKLFPDTPGLWSVRVGPPRKPGDLPEGFQSILDEISRKHDVYLQVEQSYKEGKLTIGAFANLVGSNVLDVWSGMIRKPDLGLRCCLGNIPERSYALSLLRKNSPKLIIDVISLITLYDTKAGYVVVKKFRKLGIAQTTIDLLRQTLDDRKGIQSKGFMTIGKEGDSFTRQEISAEDVNRQIKILESILNWTANNCEIIPCTTALNMNRTQKQHLEKLLGTMFIDTVLIANETESLLYSDDERLRNFAKSEFNVNGVWTQVVLMHCLNAGTIERTIYNDAVIKLVCSYYYHTSIDSAIMVEAARKSKWVPTQPYITVLQILNGRNSDEFSALAVASNFLYELWKQSILAQQRNYLLYSLLDAIVTDRNRRVILEKLVANIRARFYLWPTAMKQIILSIESWKQLHII